MAAYKQIEYLHKLDHAAFDKEFEPGTIAVNSGIYRCTNCGDEAACTKGDPLPPQDHRQHIPIQGPIRWRLVVFAEQTRPEQRGNRSDRIKHRD